MPFPVLQERDVSFISFTHKVSLADAVQRTLSLTPAMVSSGVVNPDHGHVSIVNQSVNLAASRHVSAGVLIEGPLDGPDYTLYSARIEAGILGSGVVPYAFIAMAATASSNSQSQGSGVIFSSSLAWGSAVSMFGSVNYEGVVALKNPGRIDGVDRTNNPLAFGVCYVAGTTDPPNSRLYGHVSVQRLVTPAPAMIDRRKK